MATLEPQPGRGPSAIDPIVAAFPAAPLFRLTTRPVEQFSTASRFFDAFYAPCHHFFVRASEWPQEKWADGGGYATHMPKCRRSVRATRFQGLFTITGEIFHAGFLRALRVSSSLMGGNFAPPEMEERRDDFNPTATQRFNHRRLPATAPAQARDRRSRHGAARQLVHHRRLPATAPAQTGDRRSRHGATRQLVHHGRLPAASLGRSTVTAE